MDKKQRAASLEAKVRFLRARLQRYALTAPVYRVAEIERLAAEDELVDLLRALTTPTFIAEE